MHVDNYVLTCI